MADSVELRMNNVLRNEESSGQRVDILECTLRDGSYAVDFKFTENDTAILAGVLGRLGFRWIEVGHGVGLGAMKAGKGTMPATDERLIEAAKRAAPNAQIGCFFIPGIGTADQLRSARAAGMDFVRIGYNAPEIEDAYPYLTLARELGLKPCLNFMKTYGISPAAFGEKAREGAAAGAEVIYCVDSAGSMFPEDVRKYLSAARERSECKLGFHGHSNLQFAVANSVEAVRCGASFIDSTLFGLGRSAGNVPTEIAVAVFNNLGIETGIDLFEVMDAAEEFMGPLMSQMQLYDMMSVAMGCSQFHSSFLPKVAAAAHQHGVELRRLVVAMGKLDPVNLDERQSESRGCQFAESNGGEEARDADVVRRAWHLGAQHQQFALGGAVVGRGNDRDLRQTPRPACAGTRRFRIAFSRSGPGGPGAGGRSGCARPSSLRFIRNARTGLEDDGQ